MRISFKYNLFYAKIKIYKICQNRAKVYKDLVFDFQALQNYANIVDFEKRIKVSTHSQKSPSIHLRTSPDKRAVSLGLASPDLEPEPFIA